MSTTRTQTFTFAINADRYLNDVYFSEDYARALYLEGLGFTEFNQVRFDRAADGRIDRTLRLCPKMNAPKPVQKALGSTQQYDEIGHLDSGSRTWRYEVVPATMANKIKTVGSMTVEPTGDDQCKVTFQATFDVKMFGVGGVVERFMAGQFDDNIAAQSRFTERWIAKQ